MENPQSGQLHASNRILGFASFHCIFFIVILANVSLLIGLYYHPKEVGLYILLPYYTYTKVLTRTEFKDGSRWRWFSENFFLFRMMRQHLQLSLDVPKALVDAEKKTGGGAQFIFAVFPHGTASDYRILMDGMIHKHLPVTSEKLKVLAASVLFLIPVVREFAMWTGCIDARRSVAEYVLKKGDSILVLPGGEAEQIRTIYQRERIYLKNRKGFIKLAMRHGIGVVPVYVFGANDLYYTSNLFFGPRQWLQKNMGICVPLAFGMWGSVFCPLPVETTVVFGDPLTFEIKDQGSPTDKELDAAHKKFMDALLDLFESHKSRLGFGDRELEIL